VRIVRSVIRNEGDDTNYFVECEEGELGRIVTRGFNIMKEYVNNEEETTQALHVTEIVTSTKQNDQEGEESFLLDGRELNQLPWYSNLGDVGFYYWINDNQEENVSNEEEINEEEKKKEQQQEEVEKRRRKRRRGFYWVSRESNLLIKGGANYAYDQINGEISSFVSSFYGVEEGTDFKVAVVGLREKSEHEDECCVTIQLLSPKGEGINQQLQKTFIRECSRAVTKGAKPNRFRIGEIPTNFKGIVQTKDLLEQWK